MNQSKLSHHYMEMSALQVRITDCVLHLDRLPKFTATPMEESTRRSLQKDFGGIFISIIKRKYLFPVFILHEHRSRQEVVSSYIFLISP